MKELTYKIVYSPSESFKSTRVNLLCADDKVHIRLREYDHEEVIHGFIEKLTYVITYLLSKYEYTEETADIILKKFSEKDWSFFEVNDAVTGGLFGCKGIKISKCYRKIKQAHKNLLGKFSLGTCPVSSNISISTLSDEFRMLSVKEFLFNDAIDIVITKKKPNKDSYSKFIKKESRVKTPKSVKKDLEVFSLLSD